MRLPKKEKKCKELLNKFMTVSNKLQILKEKTGVAWEFPNDSYLNNKSIINALTTQVSLAENDFKKEYDAYEHLKDEKLNQIKKLIDECPSLFKELRDDDYGYKLHKLICKPAKAITKNSLIDTINSFNRNNSRYRIETNVRDLEWEDYLEWRDSQ